MASVFPNGFVLAFAALPIIIFVSSVFTVLYHLGVIQLVVRFLAKLMMPVLGTSGAETLSAVANVLNVAAMLIAFLAFIAMIDYLLALIRSDLSLSVVMAIFFSPVAALIGVPSPDVPVIADLLGTKLVTNEMESYVKLNGEYSGVISDRGHILATYALTGFANLGSIGVLLGGIGAMAPERRADLARLSSKALLEAMLKACGLSLKLATLGARFEHNFTSFYIKMPGLPRPEGSAGERQGHPE